MDSELAGGPYCAEQARQRPMRVTPRFTKPALAAYPDYLRPRSCEVCSSRENLAQCKNCLVTYYCSQEHQASDLERHTEKCRYMAFDWLLDGNCPHAQNCHTFTKVDIMLHLFPNIAAAETSRRRLFSVQVHSRKSRTFEHQCDSKDNEAWEYLYKAIADLIPVIDVRLGRDEEAYRFIYQETQNNTPWYAIERNLYRKLGSAAADDAAKKRHRSFEQIHKLNGLGHQVVLTLMAIKALRMVQDVQKISLALRRTNACGNVLPQETIDLICGHLGPDFLASLFGIDLLRATSDATWTRNKVWEMQWVVTKCVYETARSNKHIWRWMLDTNRLEARGEFGQFSTEAGWDVEEAAEMVAVRQYQTWVETPGSFDILRRAMAAAARWASAKEEICWPIERPRDPKGSRSRSRAPRKKQRTQNARVRTSVEAMPEVYHYHQLTLDENLDLNSHHHQLTRLTLDEEIAGLNDGGAFGSVVGL